jgi:hypothetical protein
MTMKSADASRGVGEPRRSDVTANRLKFADVRAIAQARIFEVLRKLGIQGRVHGAGDICSPFVTDNNPSFTVWVSGRATGAFKDHRGIAQGDVFDLVAYAIGKSGGSDKRGRREALQYLADLFNLTPMSEAERQAIARANAERQKRQLTIARKQNAADEREILEIWRACRSVGGTLAEIYLREVRKVALTEFPIDLRFHPALPCMGQTWPAMVAGVRNGVGKLIGLHRTFLDHDGRKAPFENPKRAKGHIRGGAARLGMPNGTTCGAAEGIENGLTALQLFGLPVFCALGANIAGLQFPSNVRTVVIFGDRGKADVPASCEASEHAVRQGREEFLRRGLKVIQSLPPLPARDWNDVLLQGIHV